jgi:hypothetical protein
MRSDDTTTGQAKISSILGGAGMEFISAKYRRDTPGNTSGQYPFHDPSLGTMDDFVRDYYTTTQSDGEASDTSAVPEGHPEAYSELLCRSEKCS